MPDRSLPDERHLVRMKYIHFPCTAHDSINTAYTSSRMMLLI